MISGYNWLFPTTYTFIVVCISIQTIIFTYTLILVDVITLYVYKKIWTTENIFDGKSFFSSYLWWKTLFIPKCDGKLHKVLNYDKCLFNGSRTSLTFMRSVRSLENWTGLPSIKLIFNIICMMCLTWQIANITL